MIWLSGALRPEYVGVAGLGFMGTPNGGGGIGVDCLTRLPWAADSGLWSAQGARQFDLGRYLRWLDARRPYLPTCLFATAPDVVGDAAATWERSAPVLPQLRAMGYPAALVAQDGWERQPVDWDAFDVLFIGGTNEFKLAESTYALVRGAKVRGYWCHMGRVNGLGRLRAALSGGYDSADGTKLARGPKTNWPLVQRWLASVAAQSSSLWADDAVNHERALAPEEAPHV